MFRKNAAGQTTGFILRTVQGTAVTSGTWALTFSKDGGAFASGTGTGVYNATGGCWMYTWPVADTNADHIAAVASVTGALSELLNLYPVPVNATTGLPSVDVGGYLGTTAPSLVGSAFPADVVSISGDSTAADNLEAMLDGTGGVTLKLAHLLIDCSDASPGIQITSATGNAISLESTATAVYITSYGGSGIYIEANDANNGAIHVSNSGAGPGIYSNTVATGAVTVTPAEGSHGISVVAGDLDHNAIYIGMGGFRYGTESLATLGADVVSLVTRLTFARAGYLDKLNVAGTLANTDNAASFKADVSGLATSTQALAIQALLEADATIDTSGTPWQLVLTHKTTNAELLRKDLKDTAGASVTASTTVVGQATEPE